MRAPKSAPRETEQEQFERRTTDRWHLGKEIPIVLVAAVLIQTAGGIWWMAQLSGKIDNAIATINELKAERYSREDARRDRELVDQKFQQELQADRELDRRISSGETRLDRLEHK